MKILGAAPGLRAAFKKGEIEGDAEEPLEEAPLADLA